MVFLQNNRGLAVVLALHTLLHCLAMCELGVDYNLNSDDLSYVNAGIDLAENGVISMHGVISAQIMPMMNFIIAIFSLFFKGQWLWLSLKILWLVFWLATIVFFFLLVKPFSGTKLATIGCLLLLLPEFIWMNNLILTETPFVLGLLGTFYYSFRLEKTRAISDLIFMTMFYLFTVLLKANFAPYPAFLATYLLLKNYPKSLLIKQIIIAGGIVMVFFVPWVIRNYNLFGKFIPLTYGGGNPMLLGTYQGEGFPNKSPIEYEEYVKTKANPEMKKYLDGGDVPAHKKAYYSLLKDKIVAKKRIADWWSSDKVSFLKSYLLIKPKILVKDVFYWRRIFNIPANILNLVRRLLLIVFCLVVFSILLRKNKSLELLFITFNYVFQILVYSTTFAFDRYNQSIWPLALIVIVSGISYLYISTSQLISGLFRNIKVKNVAD